MTKKPLYYITALSLSLLLSACASLDELMYRDFQVSTNQKLWLSGVYEEHLAFTEAYPERQSSQHLEVINAGLWLARTRQGTLEPTLTYAFDLNVVTPFENTVYSRAILENPASPDEPIQYQAPLEPSANSSNITHGPVTGLVMGEQYQLVYEVYADENYSQLLERIVQPIMSPADNSSGCIELTPGYMEEHFSRVPDMNNSSRAFVPVEYVQIYCDTR